MYLPYPNGSDIVEGGVGACGEEVETCVDCTCVWTCHKFESLCDLCTCALRC